MGGREMKNERLTTGKAWRFLKTVTLWNLCFMQVGLIMCAIMQCATGYDFTGVACGIGAAGGIEALVGGLMKVFEIIKGKNE